jgi:hypothetical protein
MKNSVPRGYPRTENCFAAPKPAAIKTTPKAPNYKVQQAASTGKGMGKSGY